MKRLLARGPAVRVMAWSEGGIMKIGLSMRIVFLRGNQGMAEWRKTYRRLRLSEQRVYGIAGGDDKEFQGRST